MDFSVVNGGTENANVVASLISTYLGSIIVWTDVFDHLVSCGISNNLLIVRGVYGHRCLC